MHPNDLGVAAENQTTRPISAPFEPCQWNRVLGVGHFAVFGGASVLASRNLLALPIRIRLVSSLAPPDCTATGFSMDPTDTCRGSGFGPVPEFLISDLEKSV